MVAQVIDALRQPEYTGENRCVPCTAVNLVIALILAAVVWLFVPPPAAPLLGGLVLLVAVGAIYLRGYLVPGTPWFTKTYFPDWLLRRFDKHPATIAQTPDEDVDVEAVLVEAGALEDCEHGEDLCLTPEFERAWHERIATLRREDTSRDDLAEVLGVDAERLVIEERGEAFIVRDHHVRVGQWESRAAYLADVAAAKVLEDRVAGWSSLAVEQRGGLLTGLRLFVEQCPSCDGPVTIEEEAVQSCCRSFDVVAAACADCGERLFEAELPEAA